MYDHTDWTPQQRAARRVELEGTMAGYCAQREAAVKAQTVLPQLVTTLRESVEAAKDATEAHRQAHLYSGAAQLAYAQGDARWQDHARKFVDARLSAQLHGARVVELATDLEHLMAEARQSA